MFERVCVRERRKERMGERKEKRCREEGRDTHMREEREGKRGERRGRAREKREESENVRKGGRGGRPQL